jgi:DNA-binding response OmpR family regulator
MSQQKQFGHLRLVLVERNDDVRSALEGFFSRSGATVRAYTNLDDALKVISGFEPNLIIVCASLLDVDGRGFIEDLRPLEPSLGDSVQVLVLSDVGRPNTRFRLRQAGFPAILQKPFAPRDLINAISRLGLLS